MLLNCIQIVQQNEVSDIYVCRDEIGVDKTRYTVLAIKDHMVSLSLLQACMKDGTSEDKYLVDHFSDHGMDILVFPYANKRPLDEFYMGKVLSTEQCEDICLNLVLACIGSGMPWSLLYLVLEQGLFQLSKDMSTYISFEIDLSDYDPTRTEKDCVVACARLVLKILEDRFATKAICYQLINKRSISEGYRSFSELYKDVLLSATPEKKRNVFKRIKDFIYRHRDAIFRVLLFVCVIFGLIALLSLIFQLATGQVPWLKFFVNGFKVIGTEYLNQ